MARALLDAICNGNISLAKDIIENNSLRCVDSQTSRRDGTALFFCCSRGYLDLVRLLINKHANVNARNKCQATPLHAASDNNHFEIVRLLVVQGANINAQTHRGDTPLHLAAFRGHADIAQYLAESGADFLLSNESNMTPAVEATVQGHTEVGKYLNAFRDMYGPPQSPSSTPTIEPSSSRMVLLGPPPTTISCTASSPTTTLPQSQINQYQYQKQQQQQQQHRFPPTTTVYHRVANIVQITPDRRESPDVGHHHRHHHHHHHHHQQQQQQQQQHQCQGKQHQEQVSSHLDTQLLPYPPVSNSANSITNAKHQPPSPYDSVPADNLHNSTKDKLLQGDGRIDYINDDQNPVSLSQKMLFSTVDPSRKSHDRQQQHSYVLRHPHPSNNHHHHQRSLSSVVHKKYIPHLEPWEPAEAFPKEPEESIDTIIVVYPPPSIAEPQTPLDLNQHFPRAQHSLIVSNNSMLPKRNSSPFHADESNERRDNRSRRLSSKSNVHSVLSNGSDGSSGSSYMGDARRDDFDFLPCFSSLIPHHNSDIVENQPTPKTATPQPQQPPPPPRPPSSTTAMTHNNSLPSINLLPRNNIPPTAYQRLPSTPTSITSSVELGDLMHFDSSLVNQESTNSSLNLRTPSPMSVELPESPQESFGRVRSMETSAKQHNSTTEVEIETDSDSIGDLHFTSKMVSDDADDDYNNYGHFMTHSAQRGRRNRGVTDNYSLNNEGVGVCYYDYRRKNDRTIGDSSSSGSSSNSRGGLSLNDLSAPKRRSTAGADAENSLNFWNIPVAGI